MIYLLDHVIKDSCFPGVNFIPGLLLLQAHMPPCPHPGREGASQGEHWREKGSFPPKKLRENSQFSWPEMVHASIPEPDIMAMSGIDQAWPGTQPPTVRRG